MIPTPEKAAHTPGPWTVGVPFEGHVSANGRLVCSAMGHSDGRESTRAENKANARLIAAAPELLEAVKLVVAWFERLKDYQHKQLVEGQTLESASRNWETMTQESLDLAPLIAAIAKAESL